MKQFIDEHGNYNGSEVRWNKDDVAAQADLLGFYFDKYALEKILVKVFRHNDSLKEYINHLICATIMEVVEDGEITPHKNYNDE